MWIPIIAMVVWAGIVLYRMYQVGRSREHAHRERMAMIEKGMTPPSEDPAHADRFWNAQPFGGGENHAPYHVQIRRAGIILIGVGIGQAVWFYLMLGRGMAGIGLMIVILGIAMLVLSAIEKPAHRDDVSPRPPA